MTSAREGRGDTPGPPAFHAGAALAESLLRATLESTADGIVVVGTDGRLLVWNRRFAEMWRIPDAVLEARDDAAVHAWVLDQLREPEGYRARLRAVAADAEAVVEDELFFKDGRVYMRFSQPMRIAGGTAGRVWSFHDVTEHRLAEAALRESERRARALIDHSSEGIVTAGADGTVLWASPSALATLGYALDEVRGHAMQDFVHPDDLGIVKGAYAAVLADPSARVTNRARARRGDGAWIVLEGTLTNLRHEPGVHAIVLHFVDVTEALAVQEQLAQAQKMDAVGRLAGGLAHDFNNLLTAIVGHAELLKDALPEGPGQEDLLEIEKAAGRATTLTQQLLAFSRRQVLQPREVDVHEVIDGMSRMLQRLLGEDVRLEVRRGLLGGAVKADPAQLERVLLNLAINAREAMPGGGTLRIETSDRVLDAWFAARHPEVKPGPYVVVTVADTGIGMDDATRARVFEPFFTTKPHGTGLGLSTAYGVVRQSGGQLSVESEPGKGAVFTILLPRVPAPAPPSPAPAAPEAAGDAGEGTETVLILEDEQVVRDLAARILRARGYTVLEAASGAAALDMSQRHTGPLHLLLADVVMPDLAGPEVAERLTARRPGLRVLYMSGYTDEAVVKHGVRAGAAPFLQKPFTAAALAEAVRRALA